VKDFTQLADLASERLNGRAILANDEFFAGKQNLLKESKPIFIEGKYTARGKWMDGWETRRRRTPGFDWCIVRLGLPGVIRGVMVDTSFFKGNYPEQFSLEACDLGPGHPYSNERKRLASDSTAWNQVFPHTALRGDSQNLFAAANYPGRVTHVRLKIYPDGGVARLRIYGTAVPDPKRITRGEVDLVAVENGGSIVASSDQFFGAPRNLLLPGRGRDMGDGWETKRRRGPGHDWTIVKLGMPGLVRRIEVDTAHYKGNFPDTCSIEACNADVRNDEPASIASINWSMLLPQTKLQAHRRHIFTELSDAGIATHLRFNIYPDGGVSRLRAFGRAAQPGQFRGGITDLNALSKTDLAKALFDCCGSKAWVKKMLEQFPFASADSLFETADASWASLDRGAWLEAFRRHPAIGERRLKKNQSAKAREWSRSEQSVAQSGDEQVQAALAEGNREYRKKFGFVFLICATGKSSSEILASLKNRLPNDADTEMRLAAEEQRKITRLRLERLLAS
jgi:allantoicase